MRRAGQDLVSLHAVSGIVFVALVVAIAVMAVGIKDMFDFDHATWAAVGRSRAAWVALTVAFGPLAVLLYWGTVRFDLRDPSRVTEAG